MRIETEISGDEKGICHCYRTGISQEIGMKPDGADRKYEFLIVGTGARGATLARELTLRDYSVLGVEREPLRTHIGTFSLARKYYEVEGMMGFPR